jgi:hypothetical protein
METDYLVVTLDLGTMIEDFNKGESSGRSYEKAMNKLSDISKEENVCFEFLAQFGQEADDPRGVKEVTDIFTKMKPKATNIKNANAIRERSRAVLYVFRPFHYIELMFPEYTDAYEDIMETGVLKQNMKEVGRFYHEKYFGDKAKLVYYQGNGFRKEE